LPIPRDDWPPIAKPQFSIFEDVAAEWHSIVHAKLLGAQQKPLSDLQRTALYGAAPFTGAGDLHDCIAKIENELEADLLLVEHEAKLVKNKSSDLTLAHSPDVRSRRV
jgi:hypothetical protein